MFRRYSGKKRISRGRNAYKSSKFALASETKRGIIIVVLFTFALLSILSFFQAAGSFGTTVSTTLARIFGWADWTVPLLILILSYQLLRPGRYDLKLINYLGLVMIVLGFSGLLHLPVREIPLSEITAAGKGGGYIGFAIGNTLYSLLAFWGAFAILFSMLAIGLLIFFNTSFTTIVSIGQQALYAIGGLFKRKDKALEPRIVTNADDEAGDYSKNFSTTDTADDEEDADELREESPVDDGIKEDPRESDVVEMPSLFAKPKTRKVRQPKIDIPVDLLTSSTDTPASGDIKANIKKIEETFKSFGIAVTMGEVNVGPTVTQYTLKPMEGVKLTQITALQNDLALALAAHPLRIEAPIPGKSLVGIEVPNQTVSIVKLRDILESKAYAARTGNLTVSLGKDVSGRSIMADLDKMPHLLIAGATGSGKSVAINTMLLSLLYQNSPDMLKLILVDPKRVELSIYDGVPHLLAPVITDIEKTINALRWTVNTMDERYKLLAAAGKKNISSFNESRLLEKMHYIVIVVDELADLMMVAAKEVETAVIRLAQMARAVGIHLILATQRPSVNVITGLIKANITSRIAFAVASQTDSRTIIDSAGAEKLLGNGDMLYTSAELSKPKRIQGAYVTEEEIQAVTDYLREHGDPEYESEVTDRRRGGSGVSGQFESDDDEDEVMRAAEVVIKARRASATLLQSRMRVGFAKASRILDILEEREIIGPQNSSKPREVLITLEELRQQYQPSENAYMPGDEYREGDVDTQDDSADTERT